LIARATLETDGIGYHYDFINGLSAGYDMIQAVTDPRMISPYSAMSACSGPMSTIRMALTCSLRKHPPASPCP